MNIKQPNVAASPEGARSATSVRAVAALLLAIVSTSAQAHSFEGWAPIAGGLFILHTVPLLALWRRVRVSRVFFYLGFFPVAFALGLTVAATLQIGIWPMYTITLLPSGLAWLLVVLPRR
jgi:hypothetical protein